MYFTVTKSISRWLGLGLLKGISLTLHHLHSLSQQRQYPLRKKHRVNSRMQHQPNRQRGKQLQKGIEVYKALKDR
jgi:hypothetical protein